MANRRLGNREKDFWNESEWTFKNILKRIVAYGLIMIFLLITTTVIYEGNLFGILILITILGISYAYIKSDIEIIREKNRRKRMKK